MMMEKIYIPTNFYGLMLYNLLSSMYLHIYFLALDNSTIPFVDKNVVLKIKYEATNVC
jgi:hypothetical protein